MMRTAKSPRAVSTSVLLLAAISVAHLQQPSVAAFVNVTVIPMDGERLLPNHTVIVRDGKVAALGPAAIVDIPRGAITIEGRGRYLMPGLADVHVHLPAPPATKQDVDDVLFLLLANGVTFVRGMMGDASHVALRDGVAAGTVLGPTLYVAGPPLEGDLGRDADAVRATVRMQVQQRFDLIKVVDMLVEAYAAATETAKELGIRVVGHVPRAVGIRGTLAAGQHSIEHLDGYFEAAEADDSAIRTADFATRSRRLPFFIDSAKLNALVAEARRSGVWNVPTLDTYEAFFSQERGESLRARRTEVRYLPRSTVDQWVMLKNAFFDPSRNVMGYATAGPGAAKLLQLRRDLVRSLSASGARLLVGTDSMQLFSVPGFSIHREMTLMAQSGLSPYKVLEAATRNAADSTGQLPDWGTVTVGKRADLLLLDANPLARIENAARRAGVMVRGRWIPQAEIESRLKRMAAERR
jgi:imidazolonepropionase-like amidohydrolase